VLNNLPYIGRFAPSPTGPLHLGSLFTALASFLDAKAQHGKWLLRIDDIDTPRNAEGAVSSILRTLEAYHLYWDGEVYFQSQHRGLYQDVLATLQYDNMLYPCTCSRKTIAEALITGRDEGPYPNICRQNTLPCSQPHALRVKTVDCTIAFHDRLQGLVSQNLASQHGDFVLRRKEGIFSYQFAVVIDDIQQGINRVVRGIDLLDSTIRQIYLQRLLALPMPQYMHVPVIVDQDGYKLSKQTRAQAVELTKPNEVIYQLLQLLGQSPPIGLQQAPVKELLTWGIAYWNPAVLANCRKVIAES
jgi:glutamyl-Q tRNA(Asp) synthetase